MPDQEDEVFGYDRFGRLTTWDTTHPANGLTQRTYAYDGGSRLVHADKTHPNGDIDTVAYRTTSTRPWRPTNGTTRRSR